MSGTYLLPGWLFLRTGTKFRSGSTYWWLGYASAFCNRGSLFICSKDAHLKPQPATHLQMLLVRAAYIWSQAYKFWSGKLQRLALTSPHYWAVPQMVCSFSWLAGIPGPSQDRLPRSLDLANDGRAYCSSDFHVYTNLARNLSGPLATKYLFDLILVTGFQTVGGQGNCSLKNNCDGQRVEIPKEVKSSSPSCPPQKIRQMWHPLMKSHLAQVLDFFFWSWPALTAASAIAGSWASPGRALRLHHMSSCDRISSGTSAPSQLQMSTEEFKWT